MRREELCVQLLQRDSLDIFLFLHRQSDKTFPKHISRRLNSVNPPCVRIHWGKEFSQLKLIKSHNHVAREIGGSSHVSIESGTSSHEGHCQSVCQKKNRKRSFKHWWDSNFLEQFLSLQHSLTTGSVIITVSRGKPCWLARYKYKGDLCVDNWHSLARSIRGLPKYVTSKRSSWEILICHNLKFCFND